MILQRVQRCYEELTVKMRKKSNWKENIENKIDKLSAAISILEKMNANEKLTAEETKAGRKIMRQKNLILTRPQDKKIAMNSFKDTSRIYKKKIEMHLKRKDFGKEN